MCYPIKSIHNKMLVVRFCIIDRLKCHSSLGRLIIHKMQYVKQYAVKSLTNNVKVLSYFKLKFNKIHFSIQIYLI